MLKEERHRRILEILRRSSNARTVTIAAELDVSRETVRRDLMELQENKAIDRVHGGATIGGGLAEAPFQVRMRRNWDAKLRIGRLAVSLLEPGQAIFLDAGSTTAACAEALRHADVQVITNLHTAAYALRDRAFMLGGRYADEVPATFGELTLAEIRRFHVDVAIISPTAVNLEHGLMYYQVHECEVARAMCAQAARVMILADRSKIGATSRVLLEPLDIADILVTDAPLPPDLRRELSRHVEVVADAATSRRAGA